MTTDPLALVAAMPMPSPFDTLCAPDIEGADSIDVYTADQYRAARLEAAHLVLAQGEPVAPRQTKLIGWRSADYLMETADKKRAENWAQNIGVLPIFEGDANTKLGAAPAAPVNAEMLAALDRAWSDLPDSLKAHPGVKALRRAALASAEAASREAT